MLSRVEETKGGEKSLTPAMDTEAVLNDIHALVDSVNASLSFCQSNEIELPPTLDLAGAESTDPNDPALTQFKDLLFWDVSNSEPNPGQIVALRKYIPVDFLQVCLFKLLSETSCDALNSVCIVTSTLFFFW